MADARTIVQAQLGVSRAERDVRSTEEQLLSARTAFELLTGVPGEDLQLPEPFAIPVDVRPRSPPPARTARTSSRRATGPGPSSSRGTRRTGSWLPVVDGVGTYSYTENTGFSDTNWNWRIVLAARWDLWDGGCGSPRAGRRRAGSARRSSARRSPSARPSGRSRSRSSPTVGRRPRCSRSAPSSSSPRSPSGSPRRATRRAAPPGSRSSRPDCSCKRPSCPACRERMARDLAAIDLLVRTGEL